MTDVQSLYDNSELAQAAYADLSIGAVNKAKLVDKGMSDIQASEFAKRYTDVLAKIDDPESGLQAYVFLKADGGLAVGIRGTTQPIENRGQSNNSSIKMMQASKT